MKTLKVHMAESEENLANSAGGVQSVQRALHLLSLVARCGPPGARLQELVEQSALSKPTAHRLLRQLIESGLLMQGGHRLYQLGAGAFELGVAASRSFPLRDIASPVMDEIAERMGDSAFLVVRSDTDGLCVERKLGSYPVKVQTVEPGHRQPLGVGASGLAILSFLPREDQEACLRKIAPSLKGGAYGDLDVNLLRKLIAETRVRGWAVMSHFAFPGVTGVSVPVYDNQRRAFGSLTVGAISLRMTEQKIQECATLLLAKARVLETLLARKSE
ncbi:MAG TPA: IclR family transcriptional regulator [Ramlibacter sp.]|nr:IclR family transcriptional regulator [Ramlibacter sp.]